MAEATNTSKPAQMSSSPNTLTPYALPSVNSPEVSFHPSHRGTWGRTALLLESIASTVEGLVVMYYAEPILRFFSSPRLSPTRHLAAESLVQIIGGVIVGVHLPLMLGWPNADFCRRSYHSTS